MEHVAKAVALGMKVEATGKHETNEAANTRVAARDVEDATRDWPDAVKSTVQMMQERYGEPNEATPGRLLWHNAGEFKRIQVTRDVYTHRFPMPHTDFLAMTIDYKVPIEKVSDVVSFDGSVIVDRTAGEVTARCDSPAADILTLNVMHDIATGKKTVEEGRKFFAERLPSYTMGNPEPYVERLQFKIEKEGTEDLDETLVAKQIVENVKEKAQALLR